MRLYLKDLQSYPINKRKDEIKEIFKFKIKRKSRKFSYPNRQRMGFKIKEIKKNLEDGEERRHKLIEVYNERDNLKEYIRHDAKR